MSKYTKDQLQAMAVTAINAKESGDMRYIELCLMVQYFSGLTMPQVEENIAKLARREDV